jgi:hypothetical protein
MRANAVCTFSLLLLLAGYPPSAVAQADALTVYQGATLLDGVDNVPKKSMCILVRGQRIEAIAPASQLVPPTGSKVVDFTCCLGSSIRMFTLQPTQPARRHYP